MNETLAALTGTSSLVGNKRGGEGQDNNLLVQRRNYSDLKEAKFARTGFSKPTSAKLIMKKSKGLRLSANCTKEVRYTTKQKAPTTNYQEGIRWNFLGRVRIRSRTLPQKTKRKKILYERRE